MSTDHERKQRYQAELQTKRDAMSHEMRQAVALEEISDTLRDMKSDIKGFIQMYGTISVRR